MVDRYNERERRRWRNVDPDESQSDLYYRGGAGRRFEDIRNDEYGTGYTGRRQRRNAGWETAPENRYGRREDRYGRSDFARSDDRRYGRSDFGREMESETYERGNYARGDYGYRGEQRDYRPRYERDFRERNYGRRRRDEFDYDRAEGRQDYGRPQTTWSYTEYWLMPGPHTGRGPEGYQRSNERIVEDVCERLTRHGYLDATNIEVEANEGIVTLRGTVDSRRSKRDAEDTAESVSGVWDIDNRLQIRRGEEEQIRTPEL